MIKLTDTFVELVKKARDAAKNWYKTKDRQYLVEARQLEAKIDKEIEEYEYTKLSPSLFPDSEYPITKEDYTSTHNLATFEEYWDSLTEEEQKEFIEDKLTDEAVDIYKTELYE